MFNRLKYLFVRGGLKTYIDGIKNPKKKAKFADGGNVGDNISFLEKQTKSFSATLLDFIDNKKMSDVECYKRANIDRKLFSKIRSNNDYKPSKNTVLAFAISLKLNFYDTQTLLKSAGFSLSHSFLTDIIVEYFIEKKNFDINLVNIALEEYNEKPLGSL